VVAWTILGSLVVAGAGVFAIAKRPTSTPRYPAGSWAGQATTITGWLTAEDEGGTACWVITAGYLDDPDSRTGLVLPDTYRSFAPALIDRGSGDPVAFISGTNVWAGSPIATAYTQVTADVRLAQDDAWREAALAEWNEHCATISEVNAVAVVKPGSLQPLE